MDPFDVPLVEGFCSDCYRSSWELGNDLDEAYPNQDAHDFVYAFHYNDPGFLNDALISNLVLIQEGEKDEESWIWEVWVNGNHYRVEAWCDYTGWDCQSGLSKEFIAPLACQEG